MSETPCTRCTAPTRNGNALCKQCWALLRADLDAIEERWEDLMHLASGWARPGGDIVGGRSGGPGDRMPTGALDGIDAIQGTLSTWLRLITEEAEPLGLAVKAPVRPADATGAPSGHSWAADHSRHVCEAIWDALAWLRGAPWLGDLVGEVAECARRVRLMTEPPRKPEQTLRALTRDDLADVWLSAPQAHEAATVVLATLGHDAPALKTIQTWAGQTGRRAPVIETRTDETTGRTLVSPAEIIDRVTGVTRPEVADDQGGCEALAS